MTAPGLGRGDRVATLASGMEGALSLSVQLSLLPVAQDGHLLWKPEEGLCAGSLDLEVLSPNTAGPASLLDTLSLRSQSAGVGAHPPEAPQGRAGCASVQGGPGYVFQLHYVT